MTQQDHEPRVAELNRVAQQSTNPWQCPRSPLNVNDMPPHARWSREGVDFDPKHDYLHIIHLYTGTKQYTVRCRYCKDRTPNLAKVTWGYYEEHLEVYEEHRHVPANKNDCEYRGCGKPGIERHHFAPRNTFGWAEADNWPVADLCKEHHALWHRTMNGYHTNNVSKEAS